MRELYDELSRRFPEIQDRLEDNHDLPYCLMGALADWLVELPPSGFTSDVISRAVAFSRWCEEQPRGKDARTDLPTIVTVALYEKLFEHDSTRFLLPKLISKEQMREGADYMKAHVGVDNYEKALRYF
jgi:hypothetical protein